jgi:hypothetical protein
MIPKWIAEFVLMLAIGIIEKMKPSPEELERMSHNEKVKKLANFINDGYPGYILSDPAHPGEWGDTATKVR